ncbi:tetratricopeptide repeat protein [Fulvivirgaceae bacterium BMA12]|uniref:Tetratricopeptide repeat protein n=1 Tax=Agaribacillus aureus TaxID=3051825 RepID=A0ABT8LIB2_9BACT|nr:tetratricopeptide repeat protein [Fulvivirgaceae bacterium BMA12]
MAQEYSFEEIEKYLSGDMEAGEKQHFEKLLSTDTGFARQVKEHRQTHELVDLYARANIKNRVKSIHDKVKAEQKAATGGFSVMKIAASLALLAVVGSLYFYTSYNYNTQHLASNAFEPYPNRFRTMGDSQEDTFARGLKAYDLQDYKEAITQFSQVTADNEKYLDARFYLGVTYLSAGAYAEAVSPLRLVIEENSLYESSAKWYLSLTLLQLDKEEEAKKILQEIVQEGDVKSQPARELLEDLNSGFRKLPFVR